jgi:hypothetical protein
VTSQEYTDTRHYHTAFLTPLIAAAPSKIPNTHCFVNNSRFLAAARNEELAISNE